VAALSYHRVSSATRTVQGTTQMSSGAAAAARNDLEEEEELIDELEGMTVGQA
jgi:hypothetical protein